MEGATLGGQLSNYADVVSGNFNAPVQKTYKMFVKSKSNQSTEYIRTLIKTKVNPVQMKVGIKSFSELKSGQLLLEVANKEELEVIRNNINQNCGEELEAVAGKRRNPRIIIFNIAEDISIENVVEALLAQNKELDGAAQEVKPIFQFYDKKKNKNIVVEINSSVRKQLIGKKIKLGWNMCNWQDYIKVSRCFKCSKYNHRAQNCKGIQTCPKCAGDHGVKDCKANAEELRCINCINYLKHNKDCQLDVNHSALDVNCPCHLTALRRYQTNIDY